MRLSVLSLVVLATIGTFRGSDAMAQEANYDESRVPSYTLPDPLTMQDGRPVTTTEQWRSERRPELIRLFEEQMFGRAPGRPAGLHWKLWDLDRSAHQGKAVRKQVTIYFGDQEEGPSMDLLVYLPANATGPVPLFLGLNFVGNHGTTDDPHVRISQSWMRDDEKAGVVNHRATEASRGRDRDSWPMELVLSHGYGLATIYYGDIDPDFDDGFENGVHALYHGPGQPRPAASDWGSIATWAWGLSRALDYLETDSDVDAKRVAVVGHSRLGKTAMWAGAIDERFALIVSNNSGCGGAALSRRAFGETVKRINTSFPHWFCDNFLQYNANEAALPIDQHQLVALAAPRPILICSAEDDRWADPKGEYLSGHHATRVYQLFGLSGLESPEPPPLSELTGGQVAYFIRPGEHAMTKVDWQAYLEFAKNKL